VILLGNKSHNWVGLYKDGEKELLLGENGMEDDVVLLETRSPNNYCVIGETAMCSILKINS